MTLSGKNILDIARGITRERSVMNTFWKSLGVSSYTTESMVDNSIEYFKFNSVPKKRGWIINVFKVTSNAVYSQNKYNIRYTI
jgi:hypothetical protein